MKTILYNPIFINPQAYYVFPRLTRYLQPDNESTAEPANYIGTIEVKVIAYGDTTLKRTYTNTDSIDLSEFKNTWIRISLFTKVGSCVLGEWKIGNMESDLPYIDPEVLASLKAVVIVGNKTNNDSDRAIVKNLVDPDNPFVISNAAFKLNSGFGKYSADFESFDWAVNISQKQHNKATISLNGRLCNHAAIEVDEMKVNIIGNVTELIYWYIANPDDTTRSEIRLTSGINTLPKSYAKDDGQTYNIGFAYISGDSEITIEQIPSFEGAFVTDGIDDLITSTKTVQEMLGGSNKITVVSMATCLSSYHHSNNVALTNYIRSDKEFIRSYVSNANDRKCGIYGYSISDINSYNTTIKVINNILGDKEDYKIANAVGTSPEIWDSNFSIVGYLANNGNIVETSQVAWYWTIIANKVLTTDQINQVIAYFNLDRTLKPDILCDVKKQGITNENHAEFGDKLIDFSGNGRDIQLNNIAWKGDSGIGKYETDFTTWTRGHFTDEVNFTPSKIEVTGILTTNSILINNKPTPIYNVEIHSPNKSIVVYYQYNDDTGVKRIALVDGINELPSANDSLFVTSDRLNSKGITITQIPSHAGALCLDGVDDFGQYVGDLGLKDYTIAVDRAYVEAKGSQVPIISNVVDGSVNTPFLMEHLGINKILAPHSFGKYTRLAELNINRFISYQSTYKYNGSDIIKGTSTNAGSGLTIGRIGGVASQYANIALWSLLLFPYTLSEFLLERQLKRYKLGTLYPDMVEFRPIIKGGSIFKYLNVTTNEEIFAGDYIHVGDTIRFYVSGISGTANEVSSFTVNGVEGIPKGNNGDLFDAVVTKSPQKINITIDEYIRFEDIVQPYPVLLRFKDENGNEVSWGGKFRVGSTITRIGSAADSNLLPNIYNIFGLLLNDNQVTSSKVIVEKTMVFKAKSAYIFDNNEPNCILSPRLLRIPNSSYKILGHIPDISGHRNHGKINNSAYAGMSGANGYKYDYKNFLVDKVLAQIDDDRKVTYFAVKNSVGFFNANSASYKGRIKLTGVKKAIDDKFIDVFRIYTNSPTNNEAIDIYEDGEYDVDIKGADDATRLYFFALTTSASSSTLNTPIVIEQIGEYEGAYCLDGVDDFVTIPTLSSGGKQVLMKVNSRKSDCYLYDQRNNWTQYLGIVSTKDFIAYNYSNQRGKTYIDGILNENITANDLIGITHNITVTNNRDDVKQYSPCIGTSFARNSYAQMALYDFMLFDKISTDDKILELNEYVGIEDNTE